MVLPVLLALLLCIACPCPSAAQAPTINNEALAIVGAGGETLRYTIAWTGGVKVGDLVLELRRNNETTVTITALASDYGLLRALYPVDDTFVTTMSSSSMLPRRYQVHQQEGKRETRRLTRYTQETRQVHYQKNDEPEIQFTVQGPVHNEFTGFYFSRVLDYPSGVGEVPTFADKKYHLVQVHLQGRPSLASIFGEVQTLELQPRMPFKGLYDKRGDTVIWVTDDACRVPVKINSRIAIGSLTATLTAYTNPACPQYSTTTGN
ncbi:MAG: hypothetical protein CSA34_08025 [Desulfobulbus propionicus]|nr:MAG: hypothetical protein CSA34_08025 [Desulfobulbus propionicus]